MSDGELARSTCPLQVVYMPLSCYFGGVGCLEREFLRTSASLPVNSSYIVEVNREDFSYFAPSRKAVRGNGTI